MPNGEWVEFDENRFSTNDPVTIDFLTSCPEFRTEIFTDELSVVETPKTGRVIAGPKMVAQERAEAAAGRSQCSATTADGVRCKRPAVRDGLCPTHERIAMKAAELASEPDEPEADEDEPVETFVLPTPVSALVGDDGGN